MLKEVQIVDGQSRYDIFKLWQQTLARNFRESGVHAEIVKCGESASSNQAGRLSLGFNMVRYWSVSNSRDFHFAWTVDHPGFLADFFFPAISRMPVNPERCVLGSVDSRWTRFAREVYKFPHIHFLPHATVRDEFVPPASSKRDLDVVFFGTVEAPDKIAADLRAQSGKFWPILEPFLRDFEYGAGADLDSAVWDAARRIGNSVEQALVIFNAFFPPLDSYHRFRSRLAVLKAIKRGVAHVYGAGPWDRMGLGENVILHNSVAYAEALEIMTRAKLLLNHAPTLTGGAHERVFDGIAAGCAVLTTESNYLVSEMGRDEGLRFYNPGKPGDLGEIIAETLSDPNRESKIIASQEKVFRRHRMLNRANIVAEIVRERWPEHFGDLKGVHAV